MKRRILTLLLTILLIFGLTTNVSAQDYSFVLSNEIVHVYWNDNGTVSLDYLLTFKNDPGAHVIDFVDLGLPNGSYDFGSIKADIGGKSLNISSDFQEDGPYGVAIDMGAYAIQPGQSGTVHISVGRIDNVFYPDDNDQTLTSGNFSPAYWTTAHGNTNLIVTFHLPNGVKPEEPRYHTPSGSWPGDAAPVATLDAQGRITYTWQSTAANGYTQYTFGLSVPRTYIPASAIYKPSFWQSLGIDPDDLVGFGICGCFILFFVGSPVLAVINERKRKLKYLPPKISIEGHGIKRGLTAVEAAILMEQPLDKVMTMILFGVIKKGAASVITKDPLNLKVSEPLPEGLRDYETDFLAAFRDAKKTPKQGLQELTVKIIKSVGDKMKGFSRKESIEYYKSIMEKAWKQIETAGTPEIKSDMYEESLEWTMLDKDYDDRTKRTFTGPIFVPMWWGRYDPSFSSGSGVPKMASGIPVSLPTGRSSTSVPGSAFAASVITGVQNFSSKTLGNLNTFTSGVTKTTNPIPKSTSSGSYKGGGGSGGSSCACACACAGCACACAGGGR
jgi:hypothetical protein